MPAAAAHASKGTYRPHLPRSGHIQCTVGTPIALVRYRMEKKNAFWSRIKALLLLD